MITRGTIGDADGDIAAVVYARRDRPDLLLHAFARHLTETGCRTCGLVQFRDRSKDRSLCRVMVLDRWQVVDFNREHRGAGDDQCRLDAIR
jgi:hypothetical protein